MGLTFSSPKILKNNTLLLITAKFPEENKINEILWDIWKLKKNEIKQDGFNVKYDIKLKKWDINYWHHITDDTYKKINKKYLWEIEFEERYNKWNEIVEEYCKFISSFKINQDN